MPSVPTNLRAAIGRRQLIAGGAAAAAALACPAVAAPARARLSLTDPADVRQIVRKLRFRTDEGPVFWWIKGHYLAIVDSALTPLFGMNFGAIQSVTQRSDGGFDVLQMELGFRTDLVTGKRLRSWVSPLDGRTFDVPMSVIGPTLVHYSPDAVPVVPRDFAGSQIDFRAIDEKPFEESGVVFVPTRAASRVTTPGQPDRVINDVATIYAPAAEALDPRRTSVAAWLQAGDVTTFPRWMKMAGSPGSVTLRGVGAKVDSINAMPADWQAMVRDHDASILTDPMGALSRPAARYTG